MFRRWLQAYLGQPKPTSAQAGFEERLEKLERRLKYLGEDLEKGLELVKESLNTTRSLNGRMVRLLEKREKEPQDAPGSTITLPDGVQDPRQLPIPLEVQAARIRAARVSGAAVGGNH